MDKKGLSDIIVIVLFILLALAAVIILWTFVRSSIGKADSTKNLQFLTSSYSIPKQSVKVNSSLSMINFAINRESGDDKTAGFIINLRDSTGKSAEFRING